MKLKARIVHFWQTCTRKIKNLRREASQASVPSGWVPENIDFFLLFLVIAMVLFGLLMVYSSSFIYAQERTGDGFVFIKRQIIFAVLGVMSMFFATKIPYVRWREWMPYVLGSAGLLCALVLISGIGIRSGGAQRWLRIGYLGFQPSELAKFALILFVARQLDLKKDRLHTFAAGIMSNLLVPIPMLILLLAQPDFGSTVIVTLVIFSLMFVAGVPFRFLGGIFTVAFLGGAWLLMSTPYRWARFSTFLDPWKDPAGKGFQILQSFVGLNNGHFWGVGLGNGKEKLFYLPEAHNDFILAVIGEELGFVGILAVVLAFVFFVYRGLRIAWKAMDLYGDRFGFYLAVGITLILGLQGFVNIAVVLGLLPTKGLTLPFVSYGGSALLINLFAVGVLLSIGRGPRVKAHLA